MDALLFSLRSRHLPEAGPFSPSALFFTEQLFRLAQKEAAICDG
jgi:hypothetical protein